MLAHHPRLVGPDSRSPWSLSRRGSPAQSPAGQRSRRPPGSPITSFALWHFKNRPNPAPAEQSGGVPSSDAPSTSSQPLRLATGRAADAGARRLVPVPGTPGRSPSGRPPALGRTGLRRLGLREREHVHPDGPERTIENLRARPDPIGSREPPPRAARMVCKASGAPSPWPPPSVVTLPACPSTAIPARSPSSSPQDVIE